MQKEEKMNCSVRFTENKSIKNYKNISIHMKGEVSGRETSPDSNTISEFLFFVSDTSSENIPLVCEKVC